MKLLKNQNARERGYLKHCWGGPAARRRCYRRGCTGRPEICLPLLDLKPIRVINKWWR